MPDNSILAKNLLLIYVIVALAAWVSPDDLKGVQINDDVLRKEKNISKIFFASP